MTAVWTAAGVAALAAVLVLATAFVCFRMACHVSRKERAPQEEFPIPPGKIYEPYRDMMVGWMKEVRALPCEELWVTSFDGLRLHGRYYEYAPGAPVELMMHGYRGSAERDLCGGVQRCFQLGHNVLLVDQRTAGQSEGNTITFGIFESRDCRVWIDKLIERFGEDVRIILTGISMGASTVLITAGTPLPANVVGVLADCGYSSARAIIEKVIKQMKLPAKLLYPFVRLGGRLYGGFDLEETSPLEAMGRCQIPVIFFHGTTDAYVPYEMSYINFEACVSKKQLVTVEGAGHGLCYLLDPDGYLHELETFFN